MYKAISGRDRRWMATLSKVARLSDETPAIAAGIVKAGNLLEVSFNKKRNHPDAVSDILDAHVHAEENVLSSIKDWSKLPRSTMYVARVTADGVVAPSQACWRCAYQIRQAGVSRLVWRHSDKRLRALHLPSADIPNYVQAYREAQKHRFDENVINSRRRLLSFSYDWVDECI